MARSHEVAPGRTAGAGSVRSSRSSARLFPPALALVAAGAALVLLATRITPWDVDYGVGMQPPAVPWLSAGLSVVVAAIGLRGRRLPALPGSLLMGALALLTAWAASVLVFDALRIVRLIPLPWSGWGIALRLLLVVAAGAALAPALRARRARTGRCPACRRLLPGALDRLPRWPAVVALAFALPYPVLRVVWALGGTFGTTGEPLDLEPVVAWGAAAAGATLVVVVVVLLVGRGPTWLRALLGFGGLLTGLAFAVNGGLAAALTAPMVIAEGPQAPAGAGLEAWTFLLVYGSWFVAGGGLMAASWRYWARRREDCPGCRPLLGA